MAANNSYVAMCEEKWRIIPAGEVTKLQSERLCIRADACGCWFRARERDADVSRRLRFVNERGAREAGLVALGKLQLAASWTFISLAHRGNVYCGNA